MKDNVKIISEMSRLCGQPVVKVENDLKRDFYLTAAEAVAYGVIDEVMMPTQVRGSN
jgi:ATP-dependent Clp protease protease subunit